jgi:hypothetical protein
MRPEVMQDTPGNYLICGMTLVEADGISWPQNPPWIQ